MAKIDIISTIEMTAFDGSFVSSGATVKFETHFFIGSTIVEFRPKVYRSVAMYEMGIDNVKVHDIPNDFFRINLPEAEFYTITPLILYEKVRDYLNTHTNNPNAFKIITQI